MAKAAIGTKLKIGANSIAELTSIGGLELSADTIETTTLDSASGYRTFMQGLKDAGEVSISGFFNPADTNGQKALYDAFGTGLETAFVILFPSALGAEWDFNAIVTNISTGAEMEDAVSFEASIKVTGAPSLGLTASAGLSALALTGTGGTISPAFNNGIYSYAFSGVTAASVTVTATAASHSLALYVDGVFNQNLTSGSASTAIAMAIGSKKFTILANESGKTQKVYEIVVVKVS
jgi:predicted secreted protein